MICSSGVPLRRATWLGILLISSSCAPEVIRQDSAADRNWDHFAQASAILTRGTPETRKQLASELGSLEAAVIRGDARAMEFVADRYAADESPVGRALFACLLGASPAGRKRLLRDLEKTGEARLPYLTAWLVYAICRKLPASPEECVNAGNGQSWRTRFFWLRKDSESGTVSMRVPGGEWRVPLPEGAEDLFLRYASDSDRGVASAAAGALIYHVRACDNPGTLRKFVRLALGEAEEWRRLCWLRGLVRDGLEPDDIQSISSLHHEYVWNRHVALETLNVLGAQSDESATRELIAIFRSPPSSAYRSMAWYHLETRGAAEMLELAWEARVTDERYVRLGALRILGRLENSMEAAEAVRKAAVNDPDRIVRGQMVRILDARKSPTQEDVDTLKRIAENDSDESIRGVAEDALRSVARRMRK